MAGSMMIERPGNIGLGDKMDPVQYLAKSVHKNKT